MPLCPFCNEEFDPRGLRLHIVFCKKKNNPDVQGPIQAERNREVDNDSDTSTTERAHPNTTLGTQIDQLPDANDIQIPRELAIQREMQNKDFDSIVEQRVDQHISKILEDAGEGGTPPNDVDVQIELEEKLKDLTNDIEKLKEKLHDEEEEVMELNHEEVQEAVERAMEKRIAPLLQKMEERDRELKSYYRERDEQIGAHMNDVKRSVDAQNARVAQWTHKIDAFTAKFMAKASPETPPPAPPEEPPKEETLPDETPPEEAPPEEPKEEEQEGEVTTFIGQCTAGGDNTHFVEEGEKYKFCPEDGTRIKFYDKPKVLKTKPKPSISKPV